MLGTQIQGDGTGCFGRNEICSWNEPPCRFVCRRSHMFPSMLILNLYRGLDVLCRGQTKAGCALACLEIPECKSFHWAADHRCRMSTTCTQADAEFNYAGWELFVKGCDESCSRDDCSDYRGCQHTTVSGFNCLPWESASGWVDRYPNAGLDGGHSYCRNPDGEPAPWCEYPALLQHLQPLL